MLKNKRLTLSALFNGKRGEFVAANLNSFFYMENLL
jgi:hypothetical protein